MLQIDFHYEGRIIPFQCQKEETMKNIFNIFCKKESINIDQVFILYDGKILDQKQALKAIINQEDRQRNKMNILIVSNSEKNRNNNNSPRKTKQVICPKCGEIAQIKFNNYLITIYGCKYNHTSENILLEQYGKSQIVNEEKIICDFCKKRNKENAKIKYFIFV